MNKVLTIGIFGWRLKRLLNYIQQKRLTLNLCHENAERKLDETLGSPSQGGKYWPVLSRYFSVTKKSANQRGSPFFHELPCCRNNFCLEISHPRYLVHAYQMRNAPIYLGVVKGFRSWCFTFYHGTHHHFCTCFHALKSRRSKYTWGPNFHKFFVVGDGYPPNSTVLYTHYLYRYPL